MPARGASHLCSFRWEGGGVGRKGGEGQISGCRSECGLWYRADLLPNASQTRPLICWSLQRSNFTNTSCKGNVLCFLYSKWKMLNRNFQKHFCLEKGKGRSWKLENIHEISLKSWPILIISWEAVYQQSYNNSLFRVFWCQQWYRIVNSMLVHLWISLNFNFHNCNRG